MKLLKTLNRKKEVDYFGLKLMIKENHNRVATDKSGKVFSFTHKPEPYVAVGIWADFGDSELLAKVNLEGMDWTKTLREYK